MTLNAGLPMVRVDDGVRAWRIAWLAIFAIARRSVGLMRLIRAVGLPTTHEIVELRLVGRKTGLPRSGLIGMSRIDGLLYAGHPNGSAPRSPHPGRPCHGNSPLHPRAP